MHIGHDMDFFVSEDINRHQFLNLFDSRLLYIVRNNLNVVSFNCFHNIKMCLIVLSSAKVKHRSAMFLRSDKNIMLNQQFFYYFQSFDEK